jgi:hypothetical protein
MAEMRGVPYVPPPRPARRAKPLPPLLAGSRFMQNMFAANRNGYPFQWGNVANLSDKAIEELGIAGAIHEEREGSPRRSSSGETNRMTRKERKEHYKRKAILEREKEEERRRVWQRRHPGASESNWRRREEARKTRKAQSRAFRKSVRGKRSSSRKSGSK